MCGPKTRSYQCFLSFPSSSESPLPKHPDLFSSFPSIAAGEKYVIPIIKNKKTEVVNTSLRPRKKPFDSPTAPKGAGYQLLTEFDIS